MIDPYTLEIMSNLMLTVSYPFGSRSNYSIQDYSSVNKSDIAYLSSTKAMWINGTQPIMIFSITGTSSNGPPNNLFPFARLASVTLADQSASFLYHQTNGTAFAEEQWDALHNVWLPSVYINVSDE